MNDIPPFKKPVQWSTAPLSARDMLALLHARMGILTPAGYEATIEMIARRGNLDKNWVLDQPADEVLELMNACAQSIATVVESNDLLKKAFGP